MNSPSYRPAVASRALSMAYGSLLVVVSAPGFGWELWTAALGLASLGLGLWLRSRRWVSAAFGSFAVCAAILDLGAGSIEVVALVVLLAILAWDAGQRSIDVGAQLGRSPNTTRVELLHAGSSAVVGVAATAVGYSAYTLAPGGQEFATVAALLAIVSGIALWATR